MHRVRSSGLFDPALDRAVLLDTPEPPGTERGGMAWSERDGFKTETEIRS